MPARHLDALIKRMHPNTSVRQLERRAGLPPNTIAYYLKPSTEVNSIPNAYKVLDIADALGAEPVDVVIAFAADVGLPFSQLDLSDEEMAMIEIMRGLDDRDRFALRAVGETLLRQRGQR